MKDSFHFQAASTRAGHAVLWMATSLSFIIDKICKIYRVYTIKSYDSLCLNVKYSILCPIQRIIHQSINPCHPLVSPADMLVFH